MIEPVAILVGDKSLPFGFLVDDCLELRLLFFESFAESAIDVMNDATMSGIRVPYE